MKIGLVGLGKMGEAIAYRLAKDDHEVIGFDQNIKQLEDTKVTLVKNLKELAAQTDLIWLMVPADKVDNVVSSLIPVVRQKSIIIDGGNSYFRDTIRRYNDLKERNISFLDCGTSGGINGRQIGFCLMIGGDKSLFEKLRPIFKSIATTNGYDYMGPTGSGHYVKMVHNGIEYSLLQAYAEGFNLLKNNSLYKNLDLEKITNTWLNGSVIRSWILQLSRDIFLKDQNLKDISGYIGENLTGYWTLEQAKEQKIPMDLLEKSLQIRKWSRESGGNYATKVVAMLRNKFGGHEVKKREI